MSEKLKLTCIDCPNSNGYITETAYDSDVHTFVIFWPHYERGENSFEVGVCTTETVNDRKVMKDVWLWELPSLTLVRQEVVNKSFVDKPDFLRTKYPVHGIEPKSWGPEGYWELPDVFGMVLDMDEGTLSFRTGDRVLGNKPAFKDDLIGQSLHLVVFAKEPKFIIHVFERIYSTPDST